MEGTKLWQVCVLPAVVASLMATASHICLVRVFTSMVLRGRKAICLSSVRRSGCRGSLERPQWDVRPVGSVGSCGRSAGGRRRRRRLRFAHVYLFVEQHAEFAHFLNVSRLSGVQSERRAPEGRVATREPHDVPGLQ